MNSNGNRWARKLLSSVLLLVILAGIASAERPGDPANDWGGKEAKYVFMFIGDGLGLQQISSTEIYLGARKTTASSRPEIEKLSFSKFPGQGMITTYSANSFITDSAPAATSLATGYKTDNGVIGVDPTKTKRFKTIAEMAKEKGMKVGIISSVSINHATPASFYAHVPSRNDYYGIGMQLLNSDVDYFGGGGFHQDRGKDKDQKSLYEVAAEKGIEVVRDRKGIMSLSPADAGKNVSSLSIRCSTRAAPCHTISTGPRRNSRLPSSRARALSC
jgi:Alkaline phosphatase